MKECTQAELKKIQRISLGIAEYFTVFCKEHGLRCYMCGGGAIGATRHGGFIPENGNLDFFMPREDYMSLIRLWDNSTARRFRLQVPTENFKARNAFVTVCDCAVTLIKSYQQDIDMAHCVNIDVFPLDGCPKGRIARKIQLIHAMIHLLFRTEMIPVNHGKLIKIGSRILLALVPKKKSRVTIWKRAEQNMSKYPFSESEKVTELYAGTPYWRNEYRREWFDSAVCVRFEDTKLPVPVGCEDYLKMAFGDYVQPLPVKNR